MKKVIRRLINMLIMLLVISIAIGSFWTDSYGMEVSANQRTYIEDEIIYISEERYDGQRVENQDDINASGQGINHEDAPYGGVVEMEVFEPSDLESSAADTKEEVSTDAVAEEIKDSVDGLMLNDTSSSRIVTGYVYPLVTKDLGLGDEFLRKHEITVELKAKVVTPESTNLRTIAKPSEISSTGKFTIEGVPYGDYLLSIKRPGYLLRCMEVAVSPDSPEVIDLVPPGEETVFKLWAGDVNNDYSINNRDIMIITEAMDMQINARHPKYNPACDLNADGSINNLDIMRVIENLEKKISQYPGAENIDFLTILSDPSNVTSLKSLDRTKNSISLTWNPVNYATQYEVRYNDQLIQTINTEIRIDGLTPATQYGFSVRAVSDDRFGGWTTLSVKTLEEGRIVTGLVWPLVTDDLGLGDEFLRKHDIIVTLKPKVITPESDQLKAIAKPIETADTGRFTINDVPYGEYMLCIKRPGYLLRCMEITISPDDPTVIELAPPGVETVFNLWWGDVNGDYSINNLDSMMILELLEMRINAYHPDYNPACDLNADGSINNLDIMMALENFGENILGYPGAENIDLSAIFSNPSDVINLKNIDRTQNAITLTWNPVNYATQYEVKYNDQLVKTIDTEISIDGLASATQYDFLVRAISDDRFGNWSNISVKTLNIDGTDSDDTVLHMNVQTAKLYDVVFSGDSIKDLSDQRFNISYDPQMLELIDLASQTYGSNKSPGLVSGTDIEVVSMNSGEIELRVNRSLSEGQVWSGTVSIVKFKGIKDGESSISFERKSAK